MARAPTRRPRTLAGATAVPRFSSYVADVPPPLDAPDVPSSAGHPSAEDPREEPIRVLCVEDNAGVAAAIRIRLDRETDIDWRGNLPTADGLLERVERERPTILLLDLDMPGPDPLTALSVISKRHPSTRAVIFSGHVRVDLVERAIEAGAWGYVSKNDGETSLPSVLRRVAKGEFVLSPEVRAVWGG